jgi:hypothetical protein
LTRGKLALSERRFVVISCDSHLGRNHVDFSPSFEGKHAETYRERKEMSLRAAAIIAQRGRAAAGPARP